MIPEGPNPVEGGCLNGNFLCGVVEGFYGKPWSTEQRKKLFKRMKKMGMNTYLYAPKDDCKHRMFWRDLYSVEEADHLTSLIDDAKESSVDFVYALSPGLDITFSNSKDVMHLKRKLEQVASFGCKSFALLFDDIDVDMCEADKAVFQSFAHAQVSVSNETFQYLGQPKFLFCPTEYCATRAVPNVATSEYLTTIGAKSLPGIDIMWTGPRVVSKKISIESIEEVAKVLQRPPVIWDNIHANDYDPKRVFLGPYDGRHPELIPYLNGVLTNPNCEFEANYIAMHTLAQWCRSNQDGLKKDIILSSSPVTADIKLERETDDGEDLEDLNASYTPHRALEVAVTDWLEEIHSECREPKKPVTLVKPPLTPIPAPPPVGVVPECPSPALLPVSSPSNPVPIPNLLAQAVRGVDNINELSALAEVNGSMLQPTSIGPMNSLIDSGSSDSEDGSVGEPAVEPMDCVVTPGSSPVITNLHEAVISNEVLLQPVDSCTDCKSESSDAMQVEPITADPTTSTPASTTSTMTQDEVLQIVELFYLPLDHGNKAVSLLNDFCWIKTNCHLVHSAGPEKAAEKTEWQDRCLFFQNNVTALLEVMDRFCYIPNKALVYDLFPYIWDLRETLSLILTFVKWLGSNKVYRDAFLSGDHEPWFFRGGLQADFQRLIAVEGMLDLLIFTTPPAPCPNPLIVRPFTATDETGVYNVCRKTYDSAHDGTNMFQDHPDLLGDKMVGAMLELSPDFAFVVENTAARECVGYVMAALDARQLTNKCEMVWMASMHAKYPKPSKLEGLTAAEEMVASFYRDTAPVPDPVYQRYPARLTMSLVAPYNDDLGLSRRSLLSALATLKSHACPGVHVEVPANDHLSIAFYAKLGFYDIPPELTGAGPDGMAYMGRLI